MTAMNYKLMNALRFKDFRLWDYSSYYKVSSNLKYRFPSVKLKEVITQRKQVISIDDEVAYKRCRVQIYAKGIELRDITKGEEIKTKRQQVCKTNDFLVAEIDAKMGGYGIVPQNLDGAIVSSHYFLYEIKQNKLLPTYLDLYIKTNEFHQQIKAVGSTNYAAIRPSHVLDYEIVLPKPEIQAKLVNQYNQNLNQAQEAENQANELEKGIESYLLKELGIEAPKPVEKKQGLQFLRFKDLGRWDFGNQSEHFINSKLDTFKLGDLIKLSSGSFLPNKKQIEGSYIVYGGNGITGTHGEYIFEGKRLIIGRVGEKCGNVHLINGKYWITDNAFKVDLISNKTSYEFLEIVLKALDLNRLKRISAQPSISQKSILDMKVPIPELLVQETIIEYYSIQKEKIKSLRQQAEELRKQAKETFENEIFI